MKRLHLYFGLCLAFLSISNLSAQKEVSSSVTDVTVYLNGAVVTRTANVSVAKGTNEILLTGLVTAMNQATVQVDVPDGVILSGVKYQINYARANSVSPEIKVKQDSLDNAQFDLKAKRALKETFAHELALLEANRKIGGEEAVLLVEDIEDMADFYRERIKEIKYKTIELEDEQAELTKLISRLQNELQSSRSLKNRNTGEVFVKLNADAARKIPVKVSYYVYDAGWVPSYDLRASDTQGPIQLKYGGMIRQSTGTDWSNVQLTLSSGNPVLGGNPPELSPWRLYLQEQYRKRSKSESYGMEPAQGAYEMADDMELLATEEVTIDRKMLATTFEVKDKYSVPSDNQYYDVHLDDISMAADYRHFSIPKLQRSTFLTAGVTGWEQYSLLPGQANIYFQGDFVGSSFIDPAVTSDTLQLSMGQDPGVVITHEKINDFCKTTSFGGKKTTTRAYKITAMNTRPQQVELRIEDQVPLSSDEDISIEVEELSGGSMDWESGKITWDTSLAPGSSKEFILKFTVKYPRKKPIGNL